MRRVLGPGLLALSMLVAGCGRPCDAEGLERAAATLSEEGDRPEGVRALVDACPSMPGALVDAVMAKYGDLPADQRATVAASYTRDPGWFELRRAACPTTDEKLAEAYPRDEPVYEACNFRRFGLASEDLPFVTDDMTAYVLLQWLLDNRNDRALSKKVVTPLLAASASPDALWNDCVTSGTACDLAARRRGVELPTSSASHPLRGGAMVEINREQVLLEDEPLIALDHGRAPSGTFVHHVHPASLTSLRARAEKDRAFAEETMTEWDGRLFLLADRYAGWGTVANLMFTALKAGYSEFEFGVLADDGMHTLVVSPPRAWLRPPRYGWGGGGGKALNLTLSVDRERLELTWRDGSASFDVQGDCWDRPDACFSSPQLVAKIQEIKVAHPEETVVTIRAEWGLPLQTIVSLADTARGMECRLDGAMMMAEDVSPECRFHHTIVDLQPGLFWLVDKIDGLQLGDAFARRPEKAVRGGPRPAALLETYDEKKDDIRKCILAEPELRRSIQSGSAFNVMWGVAPGEKGRPTQIRVWYGGPEDPFAPPEAELCIAAAFGGKMIHRKETPEFMQNLQAELGFRVSIEGEPDPRDP